MGDHRQAARPLLLDGSGGAASVDPRVAAQARVDPRVSMVLAVLAGRSVESVAMEWDVETSLVHRWVRDFLVAGTAVITNRPDPDSARQRDRFLAAFAHELRTPIAVAQGWADMLAEGDVPEDQVADSLARLYEALTRLAERALDVELVATSSLGRVRISPEPIRVSELCTDLPGCTGVRSGSIDSTGSSDSTRSSGQDVAGHDGPGGSAEGPEAGFGDEVYADRRMFDRILRDLWSTAHLDPPPVEVHLEVADAGAAWREVRVVRTGEPIPHSVLTALLDPFDTNDDATGVTVGLYLARALTVAHGGHLGADGDDDTTTLWVRIPREPARPNPEKPGSGPIRDRGDQP